MKVVQRLWSRSRLLSLTLIATFFGASVGVAVAYSYQSYTPGAVGAENVWADSTYRAYNYAYVSTDHTGCAGISNNGGGIVPSAGQPREVFQLAACTSGSGANGGPINASGYGAAQNPNGSTTDHFGNSYARYGTP